MSLRRLGMRQAGTDAETLTRPVRRAASLPASPLGDRSRMGLCGDAARRSVLNARFMSHSLATVRRQGAAEVIRLVLTVRGRHFPTTVAWHFEFPVFVQPVWWSELARIYQIDDVRPDKDVGPMRYLWHLQSMLWYKAPPTDAALFSVKRWSEASFPARDRLCRRDERGRHRRGRTPGRVIPNCSDASMGRLDPRGRSGRLTYSGARPCRSARAPAAATPTGCRMTRQLAA